MEETKIYGVQWKCAGSYSCEEKYFTNQDVAEKFSTLLKVTRRVDDQYGVWGPYEVKPTSLGLNETIKEEFGYDSVEEWMHNEIRFETEDEFKEILTKGEDIVSWIRNKLYEEIYQS